MYHHAQALAQIRRGDAEDESCGSSRRFRNPAAESSQSDHDVVAVEFVVGFGVRVALVGAHSMMWQAYMK